MAQLDPIKLLLKNDVIRNIINTLFNEVKKGKPGMSISELAEKTGIERHRLTGILEVLTIMGILIFFQVGMVKVYAPAKTLFSIKSLQSF